MGRNCLSTCILTHETGTPEQPELEALGCKKHCVVILTDCNARGCLETWPTIRGSFCLQISSGWKRGKVLTWGGNPAADENKPELFLFLYLSIWLRFMQESRPFDTGPINRLAAKRLGSTRQLLKISPDALGLAPEPSGLSVKEKQVMRVEERCIPLTNGKSMTWDFFFFLRPVLRHGSLMKSLSRSRVTSLVYVSAWILVYFWFICGWFAGMFTQDSAWKNSFIRFVPEFVNYKFVFGSLYHVLISLFQVNAN